MDTNTYDLAEMAQRYGTATFEGVEYTLTSDAVVDNYGTDGAARYYANAVGPDGESYEIAWDTTSDWDLAQEYDSLLSSDDRSEEDEARLDELEAMVLPDVSDESNACDWDNPVAAKMQ